eukprot:scaffold20644_cov129-Isochrysis_galbana.AAC.4
MSPATDPLVWVLATAYCAGVQPPPFVQGQDQRTSTSDRVTILWTFVVPPSPHTHSHPLATTYLASSLRTAMASASG